MDASLVNVFVSELFKFKTGGQYENVSELQKPQPAKIDEESLPKLTADELTQLQDQMRKVTFVFDFMTKCDSFIHFTRARVLYFLAI